MHRFYPSSGHRALYHRLRVFTSPALVAGLVAAAPGLALAAEHKVCLAWRVDAIDRTAGTLAETNMLRWPARGVRLRVQGMTGATVA